MTKPSSDCTGQVVLICGFAQNVSPWVLLDDQYGELFRATLHKDFQTMGKIGAKGSNLRNRSESMDAANPGGARSRLTKVHLRCDQAVHNKQVTLRLDLEFH